MSSLLARLILVLALFLSTPCGGLARAHPVSESKFDRVRSELAGRSFRQFEPSKDADKRRGVIIDFHGPVSLWSLYSKGGHAVTERPPTRRTPVTLPAPAYYNIAD